MHTPWGSSQTQEKLAPGVFWVTTASHGGLLVIGDAIAHCLTPEAQAKGERFANNGLAYEEDCAYAVAIYENPAWGLALGFTMRGEQPIEEVSGWSNRDQCCIEKGRYTRGQHEGELIDADLKQELERVPMPDMTTVRAAMLLIISAWAADYLLARGITPDPDKYAYWLQNETDSRMRAAKHPNLIISAIGRGDKVVEVDTADGKTHFVTAESYRKRSGLNLLSNCVLALHEEVMTSN